MIVFVVVAVDYLTSQVVVENQAQAVAEVLEVPVG